jgi:tetratricopeptide (TPR) repeat protein
MGLELNLRFPDPGHFIVHFEDIDTDRLVFNAPLTDEDQQDLRWYLETYAAEHTTEVDDKRADRVVDSLPQWGAALFLAVFQDRTAQRLFNDFQERAEPGRLLTISSPQPVILSLPWELLKDPNGPYLFHEEPRISIRRRLPGATGGRKPPSVIPKAQLHLLFVVSRPWDAPFIDPRTEPKAVLDALEHKAPGRFTVEFLRPASLRGLIDRLEDRSKPAVDILHFDGHGAFDPDGRLLAQEGRVDLWSRVTSLVKKRTARSNIGYLEFEGETGLKDPCSAERLGNMLHRKSVALVVLSACQSAAVGEGEDAMGSVAARLTQAGIPSVLAMSYSVLVDTARALFGAFYQHLAEGKGIGEALDDARRCLYRDPKRGIRQRGEQHIDWNLQDWFLPALYQAGQDMPLLSATKVEVPPLALWGNLPPLQEAGFFGRSRELWETEHAFIHGTRRLTITGMSGQGKTYLALEVGYWLQRTGFFRKVCFASYAEYRGLDAVGWTVRTLLTAVLDQSLIDAKAATEALRNTATLLILDNLENLPETSLRELLDAAKDWSEAGDSRIILTTRPPDLNHPDYPAMGSRKHLYLPPLQGLAKDDALAYFQGLMNLSPRPQVLAPERWALLKLFEDVGFHPQSIRVLAYQLKFRRIAELGERLEALLVQTPDNPLLACLELALERLDPEARQWLQRLRVFQGGAMKNILLEVTGFTSDQWARLRVQLEAGGLIQPEYLPGVSEPYIKFHPGLAPSLRSLPMPDEQAELTMRYRWSYYRWSKQLSGGYQKHPGKASEITRRELSNLLDAVHGALKLNKPWALEFATIVNSFLEGFGLRRDRIDLSPRSGTDVMVGTRDWYVMRASQGKFLFSVGRYQEAEGVYRELLAELGEEASYERLFVLGQIGNCQVQQGQGEKARDTYSEALKTSKQLEESKEGVASKYGVVEIGSDAKESIRTERAFLEADRHLVSGDYDKAQAAYESALRIAEQNKFPKKMAVAETRLGFVAMRQGNPWEAIQHYHMALTIYRREGQQLDESGVLYALGVLYRESDKPEEAEKCYREAAQIAEGSGDIIGVAGAAHVWMELGRLWENKKPVDAESWFCKAIAAYKEGKHRLALSVALHNLANVLQQQPHRLPEARILAEEALAIDETLDPNASEIWKSYYLLATIAEKQGNVQRAKELRRCSREARKKFGDTEHHEILKHRGLIIEVVLSTELPEPTSDLEQCLEREEKGAWGHLVAAIHRILDGERNEETLCDSLGWEEALIVHAILQGIQDPKADRNF